jgi:Gpi18-like mannosyltransferase
MVGKTVGWKKYYPALLLSAVVFLGIALRLPWLGLQSHFDMKDYLLPTYAALRFEDFIFGLRQHGGYLPLYPHLLWLGGQVFPQVAPDTVIKGINIGFDLVSALLAYRLVVRYRPDGSQKAAMLAFSTIFLMPAAIVTGAMWGQCDSVYTTFLLASVHAALSGRIRVCSFWFAVALALKPQAMLLAPFYLLLLWRARHWTSALLIPAVFFIAYIPALAQGYPLAEALSFLPRRIYYQPAVAEFYAGTFFYLLNISPEAFDAIRVAVYGIVACLVLTYLWFGRTLLSPAAGLDLYLWGLAASLSALMMAYLLPTMQERYFYPFWVFSVLLACAGRGYWWLVVFGQVAALLSFEYFFRFYDIWSLGIWFRDAGQAAAFLNAVLLAWLASRFITGARQAAGR